VTTDLEHMRELVRRVMDDPELAAGITEDTNLFDDLGIDSLHMINFLLGAEEEFGVEVDFESLREEHLHSVRTFCAFIRGVAPDDRRSPPAALRLI
jgi:acyl carrier protein